MSRVHVEVLLRRTKLLAALIGCAGSLGCHAQPRSEPVPCAGPRVAVAVRNSTAYPVDVYLHLGQSQNGSFLGAVPVGGAQLGLPPIDAGTSIRFTARRPNGTTVAPAFGNRREYSRITYNVICSG